VTHFVSHYGLWFVFGVVFLEVAGLPFIPGETALIAAAALAATGHGSIEWVIAMAMLAAILGAATGYGIGHWRGRELLGLWPWFERTSLPAVHRSEEFFQKHGSKAVFLGRFVPVLRSTLGWMSGVAHMPFGRFLAWNVAGAIVWATGIGLAAYFAGAAIVDAIQRDAAIGIAAIAVIAVAAVGFHFWRKRRNKT
jgi:membrane protein DedA with SNARE-associated domain